MKTIKESELKGKEFLNINNGCVYRIIGKHAPSVWEAEFCDDTYDAENDCDKPYDEWIWELHFLTTLEVKHLAGVDHIIEGE